MTRHGAIIIKAEYIGPVACPGCNSKHFRTKDWFVRHLRHESVGTKNTWLYLTVRKYCCEECGRYFRARVPGLLLYRRSMEMFRKEIFMDHHDGIFQQHLYRARKIGSATVDTWKQLDPEGRKNRGLLSLMRPSVSQTALKPLFIND